MLAGRAVYNEDAVQHGRGTLGVIAYLSSGAFIEALFENWESEFLQMGLFVVLTKFLRQKGSSESKKLEGKDEVDEDPREHRDDPDAPWPVRAGGVVLFLYERSLSIALFALFVLGSTDVHRTLVFEIASFTILSSIVAHGLTDTLGANALARWLGRDDAARSYAKA